MKHTLMMPKAEAALERLHRARCIVTTVSSAMAADTKLDPEATQHAGALDAAAELIMQAMAYLDREIHPKDPA